MAVDTPVLERRTSERKFNEIVPSRMVNLDEEQHNARIRETYARLINPNNRIEDVFDGAGVMTEAPAQQVTPVMERPYLVENARATASIFRADSKVNAVSAASVAVQQPVVDIVDEEENEDLRPTATTIQYQTIGKTATESKVSSVADKRPRTFGKREKIILAVFIAVVVALITLVIVNSAIINNLNGEIATVQDKITTVRGSLAGVTSTIEQTIRDGLAR